MTEPQQAPPPDPLIGRVINDRFRITALIARGGMGKVYRAEQTLLGREIALKILTPNYSGESDPEFHKRFFLEASTCSKLKHPNTVTIFDYGRTDDDIYYIAMELLEGRTLHRALREDGPFSSERAMHIARQICRSLREAHGLNVIHRDLKPANIFLVRHGDESDFVKVLDFGLVKELDDGEDLTQTGLFMGSPKYMSPEQIRGEDVDGRADVYALGVILYEMLSGAVPFDGPRSMDILLAHVQAPPPPLRAPEAPLAVIEIVMKALAKRPEQRFASMDELLGALKGGSASAAFSATQSLELGLTDGSLDAPPTLTQATVRQEREPLGALAPVDVEAKTRRGPLAVIAVLGALVVFGGAAFAALLGRDDATPPIAQATMNAEARVEPPVEAAIAPAVTRVALRSVPPGAIVRVGAHEHGPTPADIELAGDRAARGDQVTFVFQLADHREYSVTRVIAGERLEILAELEPIEAAPTPGPRRQPPRREPRPRDAPAGEPMNGFKMDPY